LIPDLMVAMPIAAAEVTREAVRGEAIAGAVSRLDISARAGLTDLGSHNFRLSAGAIGLAQATARSSGATAVGLAETAARGGHATASAVGLAHAGTRVGVHARADLGLEVDLPQLGLDVLRAARADLEVPAAAGVSYGNEALADSAVAVGLPNAGAAEFGLHGLGPASAVGLRQARAEVGRLDLGGVHGDRGAKAGGLEAGI